ncbi:MAG: ribosome biogenesis GTP-binding protein YihA/YsxC [Terriglobales bacterium]
MSVPAFRLAFVQSCTDAATLPRDPVPEVALTGRSNVGKSSLLNSLAGVRQLARVSRTPGRTRMINLFALEGGKLRLLDLPGYGYARMARSERAGWDRMLAPLFDGRPNLRLALLLADARLEPQPLDLEMAEWLRSQGCAFELIATKWDRLSGNQRAVARRRFEEAFGATALGYSSVTHEGRDALRRRLLGAAATSL